MNWRLVQLADFCVLGIAGQGPAAEGAQWVPLLWQEANDRFGEIAGLAYRDERGQLQLWGAMRGEDGSFRPWDTKGQYLAGVRVAPDTEVPAGWSLWHVPGGSYLAAPCTQAAMVTTISEVLHDILPREGLRLRGAIQEQYPQPGAVDIVELCFPVQPV